MLTSSLGTAEAARLVTDHDRSVPFYMYLAFMAGDRHQHGAEESS